MKKYAMGKKLDRYEKILYFISAVIVYGFCYIYHAVFQIKNIAVSGYILFAAFSAIELLVIWQISKAVDVYRKSTYYVLDAKGITCYGFRLKEYYRWSDFEEAASIMPEPGDAESAGYLYRGGKTSSSLFLC